jgi:hypothetical protein
VMAADGQRSSTRAVEGCGLGERKRLGSMIPNPARTARECVGERTDARNMLRWSTTDARKTKERRHARPHMSGGKP